MDPLADVVLLNRLKKGVLMKADEPLLQQAHDVRQHLREVPLRDGAPGGNGGQKNPGAGDGGRPRSAGDL